MAKKSKQPDFEQSLQELETIVENMEKGDMSLEDSLKAFEQGINLTHFCQKSLKDAEQKVEILINKSGDNNFKKFAVEEEKPQN
ncbi:MAG: exodeoxyribonuclease VII small subunit [Gammaproteobacteria bacterium]|nr:exodeoxyribonuclease VII small subunit [Gammaproteobacteria bacterium]